MAGTYGWVRDGQVGAANLVITGGDHVDNGRVGDLGPVFADRRWDTVRWDGDLGGGGETTDIRPPAGYLGPTLGEDEPLDRKVVGGLLGRGIVRLAAGVDQPEEGARVDPMPPGVVTHHDCPALGQYGHLLAAALARDLRPVNGLHRDPVEGNLWG